VRIGGDRQLNVASMAAVLLATAWVRRSSSHCARLRLRLLLQAPRLRLAQLPQKGGAFCIDGSRNDRAVEGQIRCPIGPVERHQDYLTAAHIR
jgi:hypothetical protein